MLDSQVCVCPQHEVVDLWSRHSVRLLAQLRVAQKRKMDSRIRGHLNSTQNIPLAQAKDLHRGRVCSWAISAGPGSRRAASFEPPTQTAQGGARGCTRHDGRQTNKNKSMQYSWKTHWSMRCALCASAASRSAKLSTDARAPQDLESEKDLRCHSEFRI